MAWSVAGQNARADADAALIAKVSLHTGDPGQNGTANEWSGNGYARQTPSFKAASAGVASLDTPMDFTGPALTTVAFVGLWSSTSVFLGSAARSSGDTAKTPTPRWITGSTGPGGSPRTTSSPNPNGKSLTS